MKCGPTRGMSAMLILTIVFTGAFSETATAQGIPVSTHPADDTGLVAPPATQRHTVAIRNWRLVEVTDSIEFPAAARRALHQSASIQPVAPPRTYNVGQRIVAAVAMGFAGFWLGGKLGAVLEGNCRCDDPGMRGFLIGAPIGATAGAIAGVALTR